MIKKIVIMRKKLRVWIDWFKPIHTDSHSSFKFSISFSSWRNFNVWFEKDELPTNQAPHIKTHLRQIRQILISPLKILLFFPIITKFECLIWRRRTSKKSNHSLKLILQIKPILISSIFVLFLIITIYWLPYPHPNTPFLSYHHEI